jgi:hypothetical protein
MCQEVSAEGCIIFVTATVRYYLETSRKVAITVKRIECGSELPAGKVASRTEQNEDTGIEMS